MHAQRLTAPPWVANDRSLWSGQKNTIRKICPVKLACQIHRARSSPVEKSLLVWWRRLVRIRVIELMDHVLSTYDREISDYTAGLFSRCGTLYTL